MNVSPTGRIVPLRQRMCGWCLLAVIVAPWLAIALGVWIWRSL